MSSDVIFNESKVIINNCELIKPLHNKLSNEDIELSKTIINHCRNIRDLYINLASHKYCNECQELHNEYCVKCSNRPIPYGNISSDIMFVKKVPSMSECAEALSHSDTAGHFLTLILNKAGYNSDMFYYTDFVKCPNKSLSIDSCWNCVDNYFLKEVYYIKPKIIVFEGLSAIKVLSDNKILLNLPDKLEYGFIYDSYFINNDIPIKIIGIYDLDMVLQKEGTDLQQCKNVLWMNIQNIMKLVNEN